MLLIGSIVSTRNRGVWSDIALPSITCVQSRASFICLVLLCSLGIPEHLSEVVPLEHLHGL